MVVSRAQKIRRCYLLLGVLVGVCLGVRQATVHAIERDHPIFARRKTDRHLPKAQLRVPATAATNVELAAVVCSYPRDNKVIMNSLASIAKALPESVPIYVWGYIPAGIPKALHIRIHNYPLQLTPLHTVLDMLPDEKLPRWAAQYNKIKAAHDSPSRTRWRIRLVLDAWATLGSARETLPGKTLLWIENDAIIKPTFMDQLLAPAPGGLTSCYGSGPKYSGNGAVCLLIGPDYDLSILLGHAFNRPLDWIFAESVPRAPQFSGAIHPNGHKSTRLLDSPK